MDPYADPVNCLGDDSGISRVTRWVQSGFKHWTNGLVVLTVTPTTALTGFTLVTSVIFF